MKKLFIIAVIVLSLVQCFGEDGYVFKLTGKNKSTLTFQYVIEIDTHGNNRYIILGTPPLAKTRKIIKELYPDWKEIYFEWGSIIGGKRYRKQIHPREKKLQATKSTTWNTNEKHAFGEGYKDKKADLEKEEKRKKREQEIMREKIRLMRERMKTK